MTSTLRFSNWEDAAGNAIYDSSNGGLPVSGNAIINGDFGIWQRGTSFTALGYTADRWRASSSSTFSVTRQAFSAGDIEAIGYGDAEYFARFDLTGGAAFSFLQQRIEDVRTFTGQKVTLSFWAKGTNPASTSAFTFYAIQVFGSGGSADVAAHTETFAVTGSWQRFAITFDVPSVAGKTVGASSYLRLDFNTGASSDIATLDLWGVQLEAGPVATPFKLAGGGSKAAELALCQRYYYRINSDGDNALICDGVAASSSNTRFVFNHPVTMRDEVSSIDTTGSTANYQLLGSSVTAATGLPSRNANNCTKQTTSISVASSGMTIRENIEFQFVNPSFIGFDAEL